MFDRKPGKPGVHDFGEGVSWDAVQDVLTIRTGPSSDLSLRPGRKLAELLTAGFEQVAAGEVEQARKIPHMEPCPFCGNQIRWVKLRGIWHPVTALPDPVNGTIVAGMEGERAEMLSAETGQRGLIYRSHIGDCPEMAQSTERYLGPRGVDSGG